MQLPLPWMLGPIVFAASMQLVTRSTAVTLQLDVPLVTSVHLVRVITAASLIGVIFKLCLVPMLNRRERA